MTGRYEVVGRLGENFYPRAVFSGHGGSRELAKILCDEHRDAVASAAVVAFARRFAAWLTSQCVVEFCVSDTADEFEWTAEQMIAKAREWKVSP